MQADHTRHDLYSCVTPNVRALVLQSWCTAAQAVLQVELYRMMPSSPQTTTKKKKTEEMEMEHATVMGRLQLLETTR